MDKKKIIELKEEGLSNREVARRRGHDRDTVSKYWREYRQQLQQLHEPGADVREIQDSLLNTPKYNADTRSRRKYTEVMDKETSSYARWVMFFIQGFTKQVLWVG